MFYMTWNKTVYGDSVNFTCEHPQDKYRATTACGEDHTEPTRGKREWEMFYSVSLAANNVTAYHEYPLLHPNKSQRNACLDN